MATLPSDMRVYVGQILNFLKTVTIKYSPLSDLINDTLVRKGYTVNLDDPTTWKYNLNAVGAYHPSDTPMYVLSLDTQEQILFDVSVLGNHPRTVSAYQPGTDGYIALCERYPEQVDLIKSILFPAPSLAEFIESDDITLITYGEGFLEEWEEPKLIEALESFLALVRRRWHFNFLQVEPYFAPTFFGQLYPQMAAYLLAERDSLIRTPYVHSWHLWQYLTSNGLDNYSDILDRRKSMFLYQNWDYLKINSGKQSNLVILIENLLTDLGVGIYGRRVVQQTHDGADACQLTPMLVPTLISGDTNNYTDSVTSETVSEMQQRLYVNGLTLAEDEETIAAITRKLGDTTMNNMITKFLEIRPLSADCRYADILNNFILNTMVQTINSGIYSAHVSIIDPQTNRSVVMSTGECLALYGYCAAKSVGITLTDLPSTFLYRMAYKLTRNPIPKTRMWNGYAKPISAWVDVDSFLGTLGYPQTIVSPTAFSTELTNLWIQFVNSLESCELEAETQIFDLKMFLLGQVIDFDVQKPIDLCPGMTTYAQLLGGSNTNIQSLFFDAYDNAADPSTLYQSLADVIISTLLPLTQTLRFYGNYTISDSSYTRLRQLFVQLCSYNVQFLDSNRVNTEYSILGKSTIDNLRGVYESSGFDRMTFVDTSAASAWSGSTDERVLENDSENMIPTDVSPAIASSTDSAGVSADVIDEGSNFIADTPDMRTMVSLTGVGTMKQGGTLGFYAGADLIDP